MSRPARRMRWRMRWAIWRAAARTTPGRQRQHAHTKRSNQYPDLTSSALGCLTSTNHSYNTKGGTLGAVGAGTHPGTPRPLRPKGKRTWGQNGYQHNQ